jgi:hypothetical protein
MAYSGVRVPWEVISHLLDTNANANHRALEGIYDLAVTLQNNLSPVKRSYLAQLAARLFDDLVQIIKAVAEDANNTARVLNQSISLLLYVYSVPREAVGECPVLTDVMSGLEL